MTRCQDQSKTAVIVKAQTCYIKTFEDHFGNKEGSLNMSNDFEFHDF